MSKKSIIIVAVLAVVLTGTVVLSQTDLLQGRFGKPGSTVTDPSKTTFSGIYIDKKGRYVTPVASPVGTVVVSEVTSDVAWTSPTTGGPGVPPKVVSKVTSEVPSIVVSPVASAVPLSPEAVAGLTDKLKEGAKTLTESILKSVAAADFKAFPSKYILSDKEITKLLEMYELSK